MGSQGLDAGGRDPGSGRILGPRGEKEDRERYRSVRETGSPISPPTRKAAKTPRQAELGKQGPGPGSRGIADPRPPPSTRQAHSPAAQGSAPAPRSAPCVRRLLGRQVNTGTRSCAQGLARGGGAPQARRSRSCNRSRGRPRPRAPSTPRAPALDAAWSSSSSRRPRTRSTRWEVFTFINALLEVLAATSRYNRKQIENSP